MMKKQLFGCAMLALSSSLSYAQTCNNTVPRTAPDSRYQVLGSGNEVKDTQTGLIWQRCSIGQNWNGTTCEGSATTHTFKNALQIAKDLGNGYRLPNIKELLSLVEYGCYSPAINNNLFPNTLSHWYWSGSLQRASSIYAVGVSWLVDFDRGYSSYGNEPIYVRAVRSSQ